jgi:predicted TIM-barrel fold metal-dependent hydrolase
MIVDCDRHVGVRQLADIFPYMTLSWRKHFERVEFVGATSEISNHIWVSERWNAPSVDPDPPAAEGTEYLLLPHQPLAVNGWADKVASRIYLAAFNSYGEENWASESGRLAIVVSPHDAAWSAAEIRRRAASGTNIGAIALPLGPALLGSFALHPIYEAAVEVGLPILIHYSGVEGRYLGSPPLAGSIHHNAFSRLTLMPHLAESNITSLVFEGIPERYPSLRFIFSGFGFTWLPALMWRMDREWRSFRPDLPWVKEAPSSYLHDRVWLSSFPIAEAIITGEWERSFSGDAIRRMLTFGSHAPFAGDTVSDIQLALGADAAGLLSNGSHALSTRQRAPS